MWEGPGEADGVAPGSAHSILELGGGHGGWEEAKEFRQPGSWD